MPDKTNEDEIDRIYDRIARRGDAYTSHEFERDLAVAFGLETHPKRQRVFDLAWEYGHADGRREVASFYADLAELLSN